MAMQSDLLSRSFRRNERIVAMQAEGITHEESLTVVPYNVNCFNWVLGHLVAGRGRVLRVLGAEPVMAAVEEERYQRESDPIRDEGPEVIRFERLLEMLAESSGRIEAALAAADADFLAEEIPSEEGKVLPRLSQLMFYLFHDTYHTGQTDLIRQLAGRSDKII